MLHSFFQRAKPLSPNCSVCGGDKFAQKAVLWQELIDAWQLDADEAHYINLQQGQYCVRCNCNLRSRTLAAALLNHLKYGGTLDSYCHRLWHVKKVRILELNEAGGLAPWLSRLPAHVLAQYPDVDMQLLPYPDNDWDVVLHSDVLEHVPDPEAGLKECWRVLRPGGALIYTIPIVYGRLTRTRKKLPASYHGAPDQPVADWLVHTEYGSDFWLQAMAANFRRIGIFSISGPESVAVVCYK